MNGLISELLAMGAPLWLVFPLLLLMALILVIRAVASGSATIIKAMHPGKSADAVKMQENRIQHRRWKAQRRDFNRRARAARRAYIRAGIEAHFTRRRTARYVDGPVVLPQVVLPPEEPLMLPASSAPVITTAEPTREVSGDA
ncbi:hypothetical protein [Streptomyces yerevanensis]|uniref:hypothetical protein n=1 Tax=Streptomyces yerevanensis TaxID=66378 RepID=UPI000525CA8B|nr:hypothetical protein [Streptomyces yerevanensis]